jgi:hypothetical protein
MASCCVDYELCEKKSISSSRGGNRSDNEWDEKQP